MSKDVNLKVGDLYTALKCIMNFDQRIAAREQQGDYSHQLQTGQDIGEVPVVPGQTSQMQGKGNGKLCQYAVSRSVRIDTNSERFRGGQRHRTGGITALHRIVRDRDHRTLRDGRAVEQVATFSAVGYRFPTMNGPVRSGSIIPTAGFCFR